MKEITKKLKESLKQIRKQSGLTQEQFIKKFDLPMSRGNFSKIESGKTIPSIETIGILSKSLEIPVSELINESNLGLVFYFELEMLNGKTEMMQLAPKDFPKHPKLVTNEWEALEYLKEKIGAIKGDILCFSLDGYDALEMQNLR